MSNDAIHARCGGEIYEDHSVLYEYEDDYGHISLVPAVRCRKCGHEILGDAEIDLPEGMT